MERASVARGRTSQGEALAVWTLIVADLIAILVVYASLDDLYRVSRSGVEGGLGRALVQLNFPSVAGVAIPLSLLALDVLPRRAWLVGGPAIALCALMPFTVDPQDLDAKATNVAPALGVVLAFALTLAATRAVGAAFAPRRRGDGVRIGVAVVTVLVSLPWIAAELGFHFPEGVFLTTTLYSEPHEAPLAAVHLGHHHGLDGTLLVLYALLLSRPRLASVRLSRVYAVLVSLMLAYGVAILVNDLWHEQVVKRGWTSWDVPSALLPSLSVIWLLVLLATAALYVLGFARGDEAPPSGDNHGHDPAAHGVPGLR